MSDARDFLVTGPTGAPLTGAAAGMSAIARDVTGSVRTAPSVVEVGEGVYRVMPTDADEAAGTVVCVDTGAGNQPRRVVLACFKPDRSNQFWAVAVENTDGTVWTGSAPTVGSYRSGSGTRTAPTLVAVEAAWLFVAVPTAADVAADTEIRIDGPAGSAQPYWSAGTSPIVTGGTPLPPFVGPSLRVEPEALVARALRDWLLGSLPAACVSVNATRAAFLRTPGFGPFTVPVGAKVKVSLAGKDTGGTVINLTAGTRTATQVASDINGALPGVASVDADGRLVVTSTTAPSFTALLVPTNSVIALQADTTGGNAALGWDPGGEFDLKSPVTPPGLQGVCDGWPLQGWFDPSQLGKGRVLVTIGERSSSLADGNPRRFEWLVDLDIGIFRSEPWAIHRSREHIQAALQVVRESLLTDAGRQLGRARNGDVQLVLEQSARISPVPFKQQAGQPGGPAFDAATLKLRARVFQQPQST